MEILSQPKKYKGYDNDSTEDCSIDGEQDTHQFNDIIDETKCIFGSKFVRTKLPYIVSMLIKIVKSCPGENLRLLRKYYSNAEELFLDIIGVCEKLELQLKRRDTIKDYSMVLKKIQENTSMHLVINKALGQLEQNFSMGKSYHLQPKHAEDYKKLVEKLFEFSYRNIRQQMEHAYNTIS